MCSHLSSSPSSPSSSSPSQHANQTSQEASSSLWDLVTTSWTRFTQLLHRWISKFVLTLSLSAARNPKRCIGLVALASILLLVTGFFTNFEMALDDEEIYAPVGARPIEHWNYISNVPGFPNPGRPLIMIVHANGANIMENAHEGIEKLFQINAMVRGMEEYDKICPLSECEFMGPTRFWDNNQTKFEVESQGSDQRVIETMSSDEIWAVQSYLMGNYQKELNGTLITYAESFFNVISFPDWEGGRTEAFEVKLIEAMHEVRDSWEFDSTFRLEFYTWRSVPDEMARAIFDDLPLIPLVFVIMTSFTCMVFWRKDKVQSRSLLGLGSVITIVFSIMSGFGIAFTFGIPFTSMTQILPFVIFGVGLDDTFIITGAYFRTDPNEDTMERVRKTMEEVGSSITLTTTTTSLAFILGCLSSSVPCIQWMCLYAFPTIFVDFVYQITFFVAILVLDEERIKANRRDCCIWSTVEADSVATDKTDESEDATDLVKSEVPMKADNIMEWYGDHLLLPHVKVAVLTVFTIFVASMIYSSSQLKQEFRPEEFLPDGSYAYSFIDASDRYTTQKLQFQAVFRDVDQSDPTIQRQMIEFINALAGLEQVQRQPDFCWVRDFAEIQDGSNPAFEPYAHLFEANLTFSQQLDLILLVPEINEIYGPTIARDESGNIEASKCTFMLNGVDLDIVKEQIDMLAAQEAVTAEQPINKGRDNYAFFSLDKIYYLWEFYTVAVHELIFTTISGLVATAVITFVLIPHWTATIIILPMMMVLYIDLLGMLQLVGLAINPLTYMVMVLSIGLLVDFLLHLVLRYYESTETTRDAKVKDVLRTMGSSIFVGGLSTLLGVVPLAFSSSGIIKTVFTMFFAMVALGLANGLILLPVILSYVGPVVNVQMSHHSQAKPSNGNVDELSEAVTTRSNSSGEESDLPCHEPAPLSSDDRTSKLAKEDDHQRATYESGAWIQTWDSMDEIEV